METLSPSKEFLAPPHEVKRQREHERAAVAARHRAQLNIRRRMRGRLPSRRRAAGCAPASAPAIAMTRFTRC